MRFSKLLKLVTESLIIEGGAGGHMWHPFDIPSVKTGEDLINIFYKVINSLYKTPKSTLKVDGVNFAFRVVKREDGSYEFARDGGTSKPLDILGVGVSRMNERWPNEAGGNEHGLAVIGKKVLGALNEHIDEMMPLLKKLGIVSNEGDVPCRMLNTEYINGQTNTLDYSKMPNPEFLVFHNILETNWKDDSHKTRVKPYPVSYDEAALNKLATMMNKILSNSNAHMSVFAPQAIRIAEEAKAAAEAELVKELAKPFVIPFAKGKTKAQSLSKWLATANNPGDRMRKDPYINLLDGVPVDDPANNPSGKTNLETILDCIVFYHATRVLGKAILKHVNILNSDVFGTIIAADDKQGHEGIVIEDPSISPEKFKLSGDFLVDNVLNSKFGRKKPPVKVSEAKETTGSEWCAFIGSFKPPHKGHFEAIKQNIDKVKGDGKFIVIIGEPSRKESIRSETINGTIAKKVFQLYCDKYGIPANKIEIYTVGELMKDKNVIAAIDAQNAIPDIKRKTTVAMLASPVMSLKFFIDAYIKDGDAVWLFRGSKDTDSMSMFNFIIKGREDIEFKVDALPNVLMDDGKTPLSATALRAAIDESEVATIKEMIPSKVKVKEFLSVIGA